MAGSSNQQAEHWDWAWHWPEPCTTTPVTLVTDPGMEPIIQRMLTAYGAEVDLVTEPHPEGGWQQARRDRVMQILATDESAWYPDQYNNPPDNVDAYRGLALEVQAQLGHIDLLVCSVGTGGGTRPAWLACCGNSIPPTCN